MPNQEPMIKVQDVRFRYDPGAAQSTLWTA